MIPGPRIQGNQIQLAADASHQLNHFMGVAGTIIDLAHAA